MELNIERTEGKNIEGIVENSVSTVCLPNPINPSSVPMLALKLKEDSKVYQMKYVSPRVDVGEKVKLTLYADEESSECPDIRIMDILDDKGKIKTSYVADKGDVIVE